MSEESKIDLNQFAAMVQAKRGEKGLRATGVEIGGVSAPTLSRIERGKMPDLDTFILICKWLGVPPESFYREKPLEMLGPDNAAENKPPAERIEVFLRAERTLNPETIDALGKMIRLAYEHANRGGLEEK